MSSIRWKHHLVLLAAVVFSRLCLSSGDVVQLTPDNIDSILANNELVFVNFYADWCRFSQILAPIFEEAERKVKAEFPQEGKVVFGRIDCDRETSLSGLYRVSKYPTLKIFRFGSPSKREYRGQRSGDSIANFIRDQLIDPVSKVTNLDDLDNLEWQKAHIIGYYETDQSDEYKTFVRVASVLRHDCNFHAATGPITAKERIAGNKVVYRPSVDPDNEMTFSGSTGDFNLLLRWSTDKCVPLVRELTFENAEELTEEGLPFLILFHHADDLVTPQRFKNQVAVELLPERSTVNFLTADGDKFTHPLHHLGKKPEDLPVIAIDSFKHMYVWPNDPKTDVDTHGMLKQFILDLQSGKLHRDFHSPPQFIPKIGKGIGNSSTGEQDNNGADGSNDTSNHVAHFDVQQQLIIDSSGVRVQIMRVVKLGHANELVDLSEHLNSLFNSLTDLSMGFDDGNESRSEMDGNFLETKFTDNFDDSADQFWMKLVEDKDEEKGNAVISNNKKDGIRSGGDDRFVHIHDDSETTTTVMKASHQLKVPMKEKVNYPPDSIFAKLAPSRDRYTILRDEL